MSINAADFILGNMGHSLEKSADVIYLDYSLAQLHLVVQEFLYLLRDPFSAP